MSNFSDIDRFLDSMGRRHPRTLLCELEPDFNADVAAKVEEGLRAVAEQWKHASLLFPAVRVAVLAESQSGNKLENLMRALPGDIAPTPSPAMPAKSARAGVPVNLRLAYVLAGNSAGRPKRAAVIGRLGASSGGP